MTYDQVEHPDNTLYNASTEDVREIPREHKKVDMSEA